MTLVLITSVINTPNLPLSYTNDRSIHTMEQRYEHTKITIKSIREKIKDSFIFIVECSLLPDEYTKYLKENTDYFFNLYEDEISRNNIYSISKSLGEGTQTFKALEFIHNNNIKFDNLLKISGRYWLSSSFDVEKFSNNKICIKYIDNNIDSVFTALYKLPFEYTLFFYKFLSLKEDDMRRCVGYECLFAQFIKNIDKEQIISFQKIGLAGYVSVSTDFYDG
jgi:hypothetical protein